MEGNTGNEQQLLMGMRLPGAVTNVLELDTGDGCATYTKTRYIIYFERVTAMVLNFISIKLSFKVLVPSLTNYATLHKSLFF